MPVQQISETYNIHYRRMDEARWEALGRVYERLPGFVGYSGGIPFWFGMEPDDPDREPDVSMRYLWASVEPSGLLVAGRLPPDDWARWQEAFLLMASAAIGFPVKPAEEDVDWPYVQPPS